MENLQQLKNDMLAQIMLMFADIIKTLYHHTLQADTPSLPNQHTNPSHHFQMNHVKHQTLNQDAEH